MYMKEYFITSNQVNKECPKVISYLVKHFRCRNTWWGLYGSVRAFFKLENGDYKAYFKNNSPTYASYVKFDKEGNEVERVGFGKLAYR